MSKYHFKEGEEVCHKDNLTEKLIVSRVLKESIEINKGFDSEKNEPIKKVVVRMIGIECHWWKKDRDSEEKVLMKHRFHSSELIPYFIIEKGPTEIEAWMRNQM
jgi:hypothetical protein